MNSSEGGGDRPQSEGVGKRLLSEQSKLIMTIYKRM